MNNFPKNNNFDLLRLVAAFQVVVYHGHEHFHLGEKSVFMDLCMNRFIRFFPGVVIFFAISGFLIMASFDRNKDLKKYAANRFLRLYPGLWASFLVTFAILVYFHFYTIHTLFSVQGLVWIGTQLSFMQFYTPGFLKGYGLGNPNGSLWTIVVELQYYLLVPIIFWITKKLNLRINLILVVLIIGSVLFNRVYSGFLTTESNVMKLIGLTIGPYLFYFLLGALVYQYYRFFEKYLLKQFWIALLCYIVFYAIFSVKLSYYFMSYWPSNVGLISIVLLVWLTFCFAFARPFKLTEMLHGNDLSYGLYIYHGIVLNFILHSQYEFSYTLVLVYVLVSFFMAYLSWQFIEKPSLKLKARF